MLREKPSPYPWLLAAAVTAFLVGSLFRGYSQTHAGFLRMFGTIGLVFIGYFATRTFYAIQEGEALDRLRSALSQLPSGFEVGSSLALRRPGGKGRLIVDLTVIGPNGVHLIAVDVTRPFTGSGRAIDRLSRQARVLWQAQRILEQRLQSIGKVPVGGLILMLYRDDHHLHSIEGLPVSSVTALPERIVEADHILARQPVPEDIRHKLRQMLGAGTPVTAARPHASGVRAAPK